MTSKLCKRWACRMHFGPWPLNAFSRGRWGYCNACTRAGYAKPSKAHKKAMQRRADRNRKRGRLEQLRRYYAERAA